MSQDGCNREELVTKLHEYGTYHALQLTQYALEAHLLYEHLKLSAFLVDDGGNDDNNEYRLQQLCDLLTQSSFSWRRCPAEILMLLVDTTERCVQSTRICRTLGELRNTLRIFCSDEIDPKVGEYFPTPQGTNPQQGLLVPLQWAYTDTDKLNEQLETLTEREKMSSSSLSDYFQTKNSDVSSTVEQIFLSSVTETTLETREEESIQHDSEGNKSKDSSLHQLKRDVERDEFVINGQHVLGGTVHFEGIMQTLTEHTLRNLQYIYKGSLSDTKTDEQLKQSLFHILRVANRTTSGGDSFDTANKLIINSERFCLIPDSEAASPISIMIDFGPVELIDKQAYWSSGLRYIIECTTAYRVGVIDDPEEINKEDTRIRGQLLPWSRKGAPSKSGQTMSSLRLSCTYRRYIFLPLSVAARPVTPTNCIDNGGHVHFTVQHINSSNNTSNS